MKVIGDREEIILKKKLSRIIEIVPILTCLKMALVFLEGLLLLKINHSFFFFLRPQNLTLYLFTACFIVRDDLKKVAIQIQT